MRRPPKKTSKKLQPPATSSFQSLSFLGALEVPLDKICHFFNSPIVPDLGLERSQRLITEMTDTHPHQGRQPLERGREIGKFLPVLLYRWRLRNGYARPFLASRTLCGRGGGSAL